MGNLIGYATFQGKMVNIYGECLGEMNSENTVVKYKSGETLDKRYFYNVSEVSSAL